MLRGPISVFANHSPCQNLVLLIESRFHYILFIMHMYWIVAQVMAF